MTGPDPRTSTTDDVGVVVVAHDPGERLAELCAALSGQAPVLVVDNASTSGAEVLRRCAATGAEVLRLDLNGGVAGGLEAGRRRFRAHDWILTFDQDSVVGPGFLPALASRAALSDDRVAMVGPVVVDADSGALLQAAPEGDARFMITSGALCRSSALEEVGGFRPELFIDHVDHDVCLRLRRAGWRLRIADDVTLRHSIGAMRSHRLAGPVSVRNSHHGADRHYYKYRNFVLLARDGTARVDRGWAVRVAAALAWGPVKVALFEDDKAAKLRAARAGLVDGMRGVTGPRPLSREPVAGRPDAVHDGAEDPEAGRPRALLIASHFFGYFEHIAQGLERLGYEVDHFNDRPGENAVLKAAIRVRPRLVHGIVEKYLAEVLARTKGRDYDLVLVLNGKALTPAFVDRLLREHPRAQSVLYLWDAISLYPGVLDLAPYFDRRFTFDAADAKARPDFALLPLFFTEDYRRVGDAEPAATDVDVVNVCTAHPNRYAVMKELIPRLRRDGLEVFSYLYLNPLQFLHARLRSEAFRRARLREFEFRPLGTKQYLEVLRRSRAVLDVSHSAQTGLTMRTIETMGARRKLITTNAEVRKYPFFDPSRILVVEDEHIETSAVREFLDRPQVPLEPATYELFGIDQWLAQIIDGDGCRHESVLDH